jgi:hypothetical protein
MLRITSASRRLAGSCQSSKSDSRKLKEASHVESHPGASISVEKSHHGNQLAAAPTVGRTAVF